MLEAHDLAARRGFARLFSKVSFRVDRGSALVVTGANGSGKTTLLRMLAGLTAPAAGEICLDGTSVVPFDPALRERVAFVGHLPAIKDELSAHENLAELTALAGEPVTPDQLDAALDDVALTSRRTLPARVLSQGQRRRIGLARLALTRRTLWLLDEPTTALDAAGVALLGTFLARHLERGGIVVASTHQTLNLPAARVGALALA
jgi:heme exporter protein A